MHFSTSIIRATLLILTSSLLNSSIQANAYWTKVFLRIEGSEKTIFENTILTSGHIVTTASGGTHECDGKNNGAHTTPGATIISAIDDAVSVWDGAYHKEIRDYFIVSIDGDKERDGKRWGLLVGYKPADMGGCLTQVAADDQVLVAFDASSASAFLEANASPLRVSTGSSVVFTVVNGADKTPVEGAKVAAESGPEGVTDSDGKATLNFENANVGEYKYKAMKEKTIRSNAVTITVTAGGCGGWGSPTTQMMYIMC